MKKFKPKPCCNCLEIFNPEQPANKFCSTRCSLLHKIVELKNGCWAPKKLTLRHPVTIAIDKRVRTLRQAMWIVLKEGSPTFNLPLYPTCNNNACYNPDHMTTFYMDDRGCKQCGKPIQRKYLGRTCLECTNKIYERKKNEKLECRNKIYERKKNEKNVR